MSASESEDVLLGLKDVQVTSPVQFDPLADQNEEFEADYEEIMEKTMETDNRPPGIILPKGPIRKKKIANKTTVPFSAPPVQDKPKKKGLSLSELLKNNVKNAADSKPIDLNTLEGQREMMNKREREAKALAKTSCIERFNSIEKHLYHWPVS